MTLGYGDERETETMSLDNSFRLQLHSPYLAYTKMSQCNTRRIS